MSCIKNSIWRIYNDHAERWTIYVVIGYAEFTSFVILWAIHCSFNNEVWPIKVTTPPFDWCNICHSFKVDKVVAFTLSLNSYCYCPSLFLLLIGKNQFACEGWFSALHDTGEKGFTLAYQLLTFTSVFISYLKFYDLLLFKEIIHLDWSFEFRIRCILLSLGGTDKRPVLEFILTHINFAKRVCFWHSVHLCQILTTYE